MYIEKHHSKWRIVQQEQGRRYRLTLDYKPGRKEAQRLIADYIAKEQHALAHKPFKSFATEYIREREGKLSESTLSGYEKELRNLPAWFADMDLNEIDRATVSKLTAEISAGVSARTGKPLTPHTIHNRLGFVTAVISRYNPDVNVRSRLPVKQEHDLYIPEDADVAKLLAYAEGTDAEAAIMLACLGLRRSEICAVKDTDLDGTTLHIQRTVLLTRSGSYQEYERTKTAKSNRYIAVPERLAALIREKVCAYDKTPDALVKWLNRAEKALGLPHFSLHKLRHYFCSWASAAGIDEATLLDLGGWSTSSVMKRVYRHAQKAQIEAGKVRVAEHLADLLKTDSEPK